jgi:hypothetical protein
MPVTFDASTERSLAPDFPNQINPKKLCWFHVPYWVVVSAAIQSHSGRLHPSATDVLGAVGQSAAPNFIAVI